MILVSKFHTGTLQHDSALLRVNESYIKTVLSAHNLASAPGAAVVIPENVRTEKLSSFQAYVGAGRGFRAFYVTIGGIAQASFDENANGEDGATALSAEAHDQYWSQPPVQAWMFLQRPTWGTWKFGNGI